MFSDGNFEYEEIGGKEVRIISNLIKEREDVIIPSKVSQNNQEYIVVETGPRIFNENNYLKTISIPSTIRNIDIYFCRSSGNLYKVTFLPNSELESLGNCCFDTCQSLNEFEIPLKVKYIGSYALCATKIPKIKIPKNVSEIRIGAFAFCRYLANIEVDEENNYYTVYNGSLYTKNMKVFIASCAKSELWIKDSVEFIQDGAMTISQLLVIKLPYLLRSQGWFDKPDANTITVIYCGLRKFDRLNGNLDNTNINFITSTATKHKTNFGIEASELINYCPLDIIIDPYITKRIIKSYKTGYMLLFSCFNTSFEGGSKYFF